jgi:hypothetical protein
LEIRADDQSGTKQIEQERDAWKTQYEEQQRKVQALERFQHAVEVQVFPVSMDLLTGKADDLLERNADTRPITSGATHVKVESSRESPPSTVSYCTVE